MANTEIKIGGLGGQGVILSGIIIGKAASIYDDKSATMTQAFGPEARGSACSAQLVVADDAVLYPYVNKPSILVTMSQDAYNKYSPELAEDGLLLIEEELVTVDKEKLAKGVRVFGIPATRYAEELGRTMVLNIVMVGFFTAMTDITSADAMRKAVEASVPPGTEQLNIKAFERGFEHGQSLQN